jgi:hypothetical protein
MDRHLRSPVVSWLALFVALGGTGYAAARLPANSVGTKQLRKGAVTGVKVKTGSLPRSVLKADALPRTHVEFKQVGGIPAVVGTELDGAVFCPAGEQVTGGGYEVAGSDTIVDNSAPIVTTAGSPPTGWEIAYHSPSGATVSPKVYVVCQPY